MRLFQKKPDLTTRRRPSIGRNTDLQSKSVYSSAKARTVDGTPRQRRSNEETVSDRQYSNWRHAPTFVAATAILVSLLYMSTLSTNPKIVPANTKTPNLLRETSVYQTYAQELLKDGVLNRSKLSISTSGIENKLKQNFPELSSAVVMVPIVSRRPIIEVQASEASLILSGNGGSYLVDQDGRLLVRSDSVDSALQNNLATVNDLSGLALKEGDLALTRSQVNFVIEVVAQLSAKDMALSSLELPTIPNELHIKLVGQNYFIKFNLQGSAREQAGTFMALNTSLKNKGVTPLEYVDVRVEERAYYK